MSAESSVNYIQMENVLQKINSKFISLPDVERKRNTQILEQIKETLTSKMKEKDVMFKNLYERTFYGGSYYDGLKVGKPDEYDLDFVLVLPSEAVPSVEVSDRDGFVHVVIKDYYKFLRSNQAKKFEKLDTFLEDITSVYLSTSKLLNWFDKVTTKALNELLDEDGNIYIKIKDEDDLVMHGTLSKAFPAFTLKLSNDDGINFDIDLVPCFQFTEKHWPKGNYRENPCPKRNKFLVVPKKPHGDDNQNSIHRYWRLSFQEQERELMSGNDFNTMKAVMKLLKKLRDTYNHKISSYYIKTIFLWEVESQDKTFWCRPLSIVFMEMLKRYENLLRTKAILYYWNEDYNLIEYLNTATTTDIANFLKKVIDNVNRKLDDPFTIAKYMGLTDSEIEALRSEVNPIGKKYKKISEPNLNRSISFNLSLNEPNMTPTSEQDKDIIELLVAMNSKFDSLESKIDVIGSELVKEDVGVHEGSGTVPKDVFGLVRIIDRKFDVLSTKIDENHQLMVMKNKILVDRYEDLSRKVEEMERKLQTLARDKEIEDDLRRHEVSKFFH